jgi:hypothetical protein
MRLAQSSLVVAVCVASCATADIAPPDAQPPSKDESADVTLTVAGPPGDPDVCSLLPDEGPCALACDPDALIETYVPAGSCVAFACTLDNGQEIAVHACRGPQS